MHQFTGAKFVFLRHKRYSILQIFTLQNAVIFLWVESLCFGYPGVSVSTKRLLILWLDPQFPDTFFSSVLQLLALINLN